MPRWRTNYRANFSTRACWPRASASPRWPRGRRGCARSWRRRTRKRNSTGRWKCFARWERSWGFWRRRGFGNDYFLGHVAHALIHHQEDRLPVLLGEVEGLDGKVEALLRRIGAQRQNTVIAVRSPAHLHHVGLRGQRRQAGGGSAALHIHEYAGRFGHGGVPDVLH